MGLKKKNVLIVGTILLCFIGLLFYFVKALKHKKIYSKNNTVYRIVHHSNQFVHETPFKITSQFRQDFQKKGVAEGVFNLQGRIRHLLKKINGSVHNASKATPAVDESGIYIGADDGWFYKLSHQGKVIWKVYFAKTDQGIQGTALLSEQYLWIGAYNGTLYCLKKDTGKIIWTISLGDTIGSSPSFYKDLIVMPVGIGFPSQSGYVAGISAKDGQLKWKTSLASAHIYSSVAIHPEKGYGVTGTNTGLLLKIDLNTGQLLWTLPLKGAINSTPVIHKNYIYVSNLGNQFAMINEDGKLIWEVDIKSRSQSSPTYVPDQEYFIVSTYENSRLFAVSAHTGSLIWQRLISHDNSLSSGVSFFSKKLGRYLFLFPCKKTAICIIDPNNGHSLKEIYTGFLLTGSFSSFKNHFYINFNNGGVSALY